MDYKVSIIVPVYNSAQFLNRCLDSLICQTLSDIEIICVNDGSTDDSLEILESYANQDSRIKIITQENRGISSARNCGIKNASAKYIGLVDSDDFVDKNFFEKLYNTAEKTSADIVCAGIVRENEKKQKILLSYKDTVLTCQTLRKMNLAGVPEHCYSWNKLYRTELIKSVEFKAGVLYEDVIFTPQIIEKSKILAIVPNTYYHYWKHSGSLIKIDSDKARFDKYVAHEFLNEICERYKLKNSNNYEFKEDIFFCGIKILRIYQYKMTKKYYLFNLIKIGEKVRRV